jgi:hypothetical protein
VPDINPDTGKPDTKLPLVESATWQTFDRNGNPTSDNMVSGTKLATYKIDNVAILNQLVSNGIIQTINGYSIMADFMDGACTLFVFNKNGDYQDISISVNSGMSGQYSVSDVTKYKANGDVQSMTHKGSSTYECQGTIDPPDFGISGAAGLLTGTSSDFTWLGDKTDPSSLAWVAIPGSTKIVGIAGTYGDIGVIEGSVSFAASKAILQQQ